MTHEPPARPQQGRATGIVLRFGYPANNSVEVQYNHFHLFQDVWIKGHEQLTLSLSFDEQSFVVNVVADIKRAADALGITFGDDPTLTVVQPKSPPSNHNWRELSEDAAGRLGWKLVHPFGPPYEALPFQVEGAPPLARAAGLALEAVYPFGYRSTESEP